MSNTNNGSASDNSRRHERIDDRKKQNRVNPYIIQDPNKNSICANSKYATLYKLTLALIFDGEVIEIPTSDVVSVMIGHNFDTMVHPILRFRLYSDISLMQRISEKPDQIFVRANLDGGIYRTSEDHEDKSSTLIRPTEPITLSMKVYINHKNIATSSMDQWKDGVKRSGALNEEIKVPITLLCFDEKLIHSMKQWLPSVYKKTSLMTVVKDMLNRDWIHKYHIDPFENANKYDQVIIPESDILQSLAFMDKEYGFYKKGSQLYCDFNKVYLCNTEVNNLTFPDTPSPLTIHVGSAESDSDSQGMMPVGVNRDRREDFIMSTLAPSVSITTGTDIQRVMGTQKIRDVNLQDMSEHITEMDELFEHSTLEEFTLKLPSILHKKRNPFLTTIMTTRNMEQMNRVDVSGNGFDIAKMKVNTRYKLAFESPIRGHDLDRLFRSTFVCHILNPLDGEKFIAQTTMNLCSN
jgi:hypothetical protein